MLAAAAQGPHKRWQAASRQPQAAPTCPAGAPVQLTDSAATLAPLAIGFIGLGVMGAPMAGHLARVGHRLALLGADAAVARRLDQALVVAG